MSRRLATVVAHPDDDTFACSGTVALHADEPGFRFTLVHVTSGEGGMISDPSLATRARPRRGPRGGGPPIVDRARPGPGPARVPALPRRRRGRRAVRRARRTGRGDPARGASRRGHHVRTRRGHRPCRSHHGRARRRRRRSTAAGPTGGDGFRRLLYSSHPATRCSTRFNERARRQGQEPIDPTQPFQPRGVPDAYDRRRRGLLERRGSQAGGDPRTPDAGRTTSPTS